ncbi:hypothetical protein N7466_007555 [Penicillium verhagenii]|uniref:uncharacterized protein n=1 Tax=Penicillium verhagenii TaxID=1562060 RepID=UPI002545BAA0|nr:uncharacterized protein N7466_007555 [Penicillium verhagenii]KAJ5928599.1 hypothetical protein N7466_007555 [Penicillium verhagenii]
MPFTELIFPSLIPTKEVIEEVERDWPIISKSLIEPNPGLLSAFRGWVLSEDGKDVRDQYREIVIFEWVEEAAFHAFLTSDQFASFGKSIRHLVNGPTKMQLFETNSSPKESSVAPVVEIFRLELTGSESVQVAQKAWENLSQTLSITGKSVPVTWGNSLNLDGDVVVGILGWASTEDHEHGTDEVAFVEALRSLRSLGELSQILVDIDPVEVSSL